MSFYLKVQQDKRNLSEINEWHCQKQKNRLWVSVAQRADKTINRSNPPPAYSPESHWPGPASPSSEAATRWDRKWRRRPGERLTDGGEFLTPITSAPASFLHQQVRRAVAARGQSAVSGPSPRLVSPTQSRRRRVGKYGEEKPMRDYRWKIASWLTLAHLLQSFY